MVVDNNPDSDNNSLGPMQTIWRHDCSDIDDNLKIDETYGTAHYYMQNMSICNSNLSFVEPINSKNYTINLHCKQIDVDAMEFTIPASSGNHIVKNQLPLSMKTR